MTPYGAMPRPGVDCFSVPNQLEKVLGHPLNDKKAARMTSMEEATQAVLVLLLSLGLLELGLNHVIEPFVSLV